MRVLYSDFSRQWSHEVSVCIIGWCDLPEGVPHCYDWLCSPRRIFSKLCNCNLRAV